MHIKPDINVIDFLKQTQKCDSEVFFETSEGDCIALKSTLSQYIFCTIAENASLLQSGNIRFLREEDREIMKEYLCD